MTRTHVACAERAIRIQVALEPVQAVSHTSACHSTQTTSGPEHMHKPCVRSNAKSSNRQTLRRQRHTRRAYQNQEAVRAPTGPPTARPQTRRLRPATCGRRTGKCTGSAPSSSLVQPLHSGRRPSCSSCMGPTRTLTPAQRHVTPQQRGNNAMNKSEHGVGCAEATRWRRLHMHAPELDRQCSGCTPSQHQPPQCTQLSQHTRGQRVIPTTAPTCVLPASITTRTVGSRN